MLFVPPPLWKSGRVPHSFVFNGTNQWLSGTQAGSSPNLQKHTFSIWLKTTKSTQFIIFDGFNTATGNDEFGLQMSPAGTNAGQLLWTSINSGTSRIQRTPDVRTSPSTLVNNWHHLIFAVDTTQSTTD